MRALFLLVYLASCCVNAQPTVEETQQWISEKLSAYGYRDNRYEIGFGKPGGTFVTVHDMWYNARSADPYNPICRGTVDVLEIAYISFSNYPETVWMNLVLKTPHDRSYDDFRFTERDHKCSFILRREFVDEGLPDRMKKAFSRLVELNGGKLGTGEPY